MSRRPARPVKPRTVRYYTGHRVGPDCLTCGHSMDRRLADDLGQTTHPWCGASPAETELLLADPG